MTKFLLILLLSFGLCGSIQAGDKDNEKPIVQLLDEKAAEIASLNEKILALINEAREIRKTGDDLNEKYKKKEVTLEEVNTYAFQAMVRIYHIQKSMDDLYIELVNKFNEFFIIQEAAYLEAMREAIEQNEKSKKEETN